MLEDKVVLTAKEASELTGIPTHTLREMLSRGLLDIGVCYPPKHKGGSRKFIFFKNKLLKQVGLIDEIIENYEEEGKGEKEDDN